MFKELREIVVKSWFSRLFSHLNQELMTSGRAVDEIWLSGG
jgi:hypothetical protein